jgi:large subunit ribosomal protein L1
MDRCLASMARLSLAQAARPLPTIPRFLAPSLVYSQQTRHASVIRIKKKAKKTRVVPKDFRRHKLEKYEFPQFSLVEAMRYVFLRRHSWTIAGKPTSKTRETDKKVQF